MAPERLLSSVSDGFGRVKGRKMLGVLIDPRSTATTLGARQAVDKWTLTYRPTSWRPTGAQILSIDA